MRALSRRKLMGVAGLGAGSALFAPFFRSIARTQDEGQVPRRFVLVVEGNAEDHRVVGPGDGLPPLVAGGAAGFGEQPRDDQDLGGDVQSLLA